jgi:SAM-dependent methyltransferase
MKSGMIAEMMARLNPSTIQIPSDDGSITYSLPGAIDSIEIEATVPAAPVGGFRVGGTFDPETHYTKDYYGGIGDGIPFVWPDGRRDTYHSTASEWGGFARVAGFIADVRDMAMFSFAGNPEPKSSALVDLGCSSGNFVKHAVKHGFNAIGVDISPEAFAMADPETRQRLIVADITTGLDVLAGGGYDYVTAWDLWEHIQESKVDSTIEAVRQMLKLRGQGWFNICTRGEGGEKDYTFEPPCEITQENAWLLVSGHLTIRRWGWWIERFAEHGLIPKWEAMQMFHVYRCEDPAMKNLDSWSPRNLIVVERVE